MADKSRKRADERADAVDELINKPFGTSFRGFDQSEVRLHLTDQARRFRELNEANEHLRIQLATAEQAAAKVLNLDDENVLAALGEETHRVLAAARDSAAEIRAKAEDGMARMLRDAQDGASKIRSDAEVQHALVLADAHTQAERAQNAINAELERNRLACEAELETARQRGRDLILEAQANREKVLADLARRHRLGRQQLEVLKAGRDRLLDAYRIVRQTLEQATGELAGSIDAARVAAQAVAAKAPSESTAVLDMELDISAMLAATSADEVGKGSVGDADAEGEELQFKRRRAEAEFEPTAEIPAVRIVDGEAAPAENPVTVYRRKPSPPAFFIEAMSAPESPVDDPVMNEMSAIEIVPEALVELPIDEPDSVPESVPVPELSTVDDLFARMRANREQAVAEAHDVLTQPLASDHLLAPEAVDEPVILDEPIVVPAHTIVPANPLGTRDELLAPFEISMARSLKRILSDEQNQVLDGVRRRKGKAKFDAALLMPSEADHLDAYLTALGPELGRAFTAAGGPPVAPNNDMEVIEEQVMAEFLTPLRSRLARALRDANTADDGEDLNDRVRNAYREFRTGKCDAAARHLGVVAYSRGSSYAIAAGAKVCWLVDTTYGACSDAEDNSLSQSTRLGEAFPTGHINAPAHSGCRCMVVAASD